QRVGAEPLSEFEKIPHRKPMLSLANSYNIDEIREFDGRVKKFLETEKDVEYFCELKFDGLALELIYEAGHLQGALTRGDGTVGENVLSNVRTIKSVPLSLRGKAPALLEVRGEALMLKKDFARLNEAQQESGEQPFANPRISAQRPLHTFCYAPGVTEGVKVRSQSEWLEFLREHGLPCLSFEKWSD